MACFRRYDQSTEYHIEEARKCKSHRQPQTPCSVMLYHMLHADMVYLECPSQ